MTAAALAEAAGWGPFFAVHRHEPGAAPVAPWRPLRELADDPEVLRERVGRVRAYLAGDRDPADVALRVAASVTQLGLSARLVSPVLAVAVLTGEVLDLSDAWWQPELGGAFPLSLTGRAGAGDVAAAVLAGPVRDLAEATGDFSVSVHILWGNTASAINGAATMIARNRPDLAAAAENLVTHFLATPPLVGAADQRSGTFRRHNCCLIYQAAPPSGPRALCGDCVLSRT